MNFRSCLNKVCLVILLQLFSVSNCLAVEVMTYNTWLLPWYTFAVEGSRERAYALADYLQSMNLDVIGLQEVFNRDHYQIFQTSFLNKKFFITKKTPGSVFDGNIVDSGLVILSRFPIEKSKFWSYTDCVQEDCLSNKGVLAAKVKGPVSFYVVNTHLQAGEGRARAQARKSQLRQLSNCLKDSFFTADIPIVLLGDFNIPGGSDEQKKLFESHLNNFKGLGNIGSLELFSFDGDSNSILKERGVRERSLIDYIFVKGGAIANGLRRMKPVVKLKGLPADLSDHFPIWGQVLF